MEERTFCNGCKKKTFSIRKSRAKSICEDCKHNKTMSDYYYWELLTNQKVE